MDVITRRCQCPTERSGHPVGCKKAGKDEHRFAAPIIAPAFELAVIVVAGPPLRNEPRLAEQTPERWRTGHHTILGCRTASPCSRASESAARYSCGWRSEEQTYEIQSLMRSSYADVCL